MSSYMNAVCLHQEKSKAPRKINSWTDTDSLLKIGQLGVKTKLFSTESISWVQSTLLNETKLISGRLNGRFEIKRYLQGRRDGYTFGCLLGRPAFHTGVSRLPACQPCLPAGHIQMRAPRRITVQHGNCFNLRYESARPR